MKTSLPKGTGISILIILHMLIAQALLAQENVAYVNESRLRQEYKQISDNQKQFVEQLQKADKDYTRKTREIDSLYQEKIFVSNESALSTHKRDNEREKKKMHQAHMQYIDKLRAQYAIQVNQCDDQIRKAIESVTKEAAFDKWVPLEGEKGLEEEADITEQVLLKLNQ